MNQINNDRARTNFTKMLPKYPTIVPIPIRNAFSIFFVTANSNNIDPKKVPNNAPIGGKTKKPIIPPINAPSKPNFDEPDFFAPNKVMKLSINEERTVNTIKIM